MVSQMMILQPLTSHHKVKYLYVQHKYLPQNY